MWTSAAPASRSICTIWRVVLPRTIESSTTTRRLPATTSGSGLNFSRRPCLRSSWPGLDERARDVAVLDQAVVLREPGGARVAARGGVAGVGHRDHEVGLDRRLAREDLAHPPARRPAATWPLEPRVGAREVDVLEDAERARARPSTTWRVSSPRSVERDHLARLDVAQELGADDVERAATRDATQ